jgi:hypothetical protein
MLEEIIYWLFIKIYGKIFSLWYFIKGTPGWNEYHHDESLTQVKHIDVHIKYPLVAVHGMSGLVKIWICR